MHDHYDLRQEILRIWAVLRQARLAAITPATGSITTTPTTATVVCNSATPVTVSLHAATGSGQRIAVKNVGAGTATLDGSGADTIDGQLTQQVIQWDAVQIVDYATGAWAIL